MHGEKCLQQNTPVNIHPGQRQLCSPTVGVNTEAAGVISGRGHKTLKALFISVGVYSLYLKRSAASSKEDKCFFMIVDEVQVKSCGVMLLQFETFCGNFTAD